MKTLIMIIGAGATGKSTLSRTLAGRSAQEHRIELDVTEKGIRKSVKAPYVLGSNIAIAGNLKNTSDAIGAMDALHQTIDHCWKERDVVITDGFRCTNKLVRWVEDHPLNPVALFVYIELSLNGNIARLRGRRAGNGRTESKLPHKTFFNVLTFRERALGVWTYAQDHYKRQPVRFMEIPEGMEPEDSARLIETELGKFGIRCTDHRKTPQARRESLVAKVEGATGTVFGLQSFDRDVCSWEDHLLDLTPVENIGGMWWKREDKFAPIGYGNINGSKLRQLIWLFSQKRYPGVVSGAVTGSPQLPMVAACHVFNLRAAKVRW
jgi:adenylate kinase family enzyme